ncbi:hypothetical protein [Noviherbaspirillum autotrophicum]|uniref:Uncharacterized protein n=1 Tax=Noviherbaspirillum autotrophicum TaxID=709839 RepID=A0A0C2BPQ1_9BURK|nr:hypothetical protein [Noviherbaspirillum autotrophicum]KIF83280.1 hypothetical protein TSA66_24540 [Noviherbaspirillum autotrophicum]
MSNGREHNTLILENNEIYTIYGNTVSGTFYVYGFINGTGQASNGSFSSSNLKDFAANGSVTSGTMSATYVAGASFNGTVSSGNQSLTFTGAPMPNSTYNYNTAPTLANIVGNWNMTEVSGTSVALSIASNGSFTASGGGCTATGTLTPRASGKNVFNVSLTFGAAPCETPGQTANGIALEYPLSSGKRELIIAGTNSARTDGALLVGSR